MPISSRIPVTRLGLAGDEQADLRNHGGPDKALHHYPSEHYTIWREELPDKAALFEGTGGFGENLSTFGLTESNVCVGDIFRIGSAIIQVSQARQPCWKLNVRFGVADMAWRVQNSMRTGWYYRVLEAGEVASDDQTTLIERPHADWPLARVLQILYHACLDDGALTALTMLDSLSLNWRALAAKRLETHEIEDWSRRLSTPK